MHKKWIFSNQEPGLVEHIKNKFGVSEIVAKILINRSITDDNRIEEFLNVDKKHFCDPFLMSGIDKSVTRIKNAITTGEKIVIYGDYDVDGITSTYIIYDYLRSVGADVDYFIPDRADEGYGLNNKAIDSISQTGSTLIITVDLGITATSEVEYAKSKNIDIIITDHHTPPDVLPNAYSVVNPKISGDDYPNKDLAGVGVAYKLVYALSGNDDLILEKYIEFAAIGTIADMVSLVGENRFIASYGLKRISETENHGLLALIDVCGLDIKSVSSSSISFGLAPRLNAAGRIGTANTSIELFLADSYQKAEEIAKNLDEENKQRQQTEQTIYAEAIEMIENSGLYNDNVIVVYGKNWHHGVIGIVSSKITEKYYKPSVIISISDDGICKASGRSVPGFNLYNALLHCENTLIKFGGHELAAGFSLNELNLSLFKAKINEYAQEHINDDILTPKLKIDTIIKTSDINLKTVCELKVLEPHGIDNPPPVFALNDVSITNLKVHKSGKHAFISFKKSNYNYISPAFNMVDSVAHYNKGDNLNIAGNMSVNNFRGTDSVQFITKDCIPTNSSAFSLDNLRCIFKFLKNQILLGKNAFKMSEISLNIKKEYGLKFSESRIEKAIKTFSEAKILETQKIFGGINIYKGENFLSKVDITLTDTYIEQNK